MNSNEIQNEKIMSSVIKLEMLQQEYDVTLQQYQEAYKNYIHALKTGSLDPNKFSSLKGRSWWGTDALEQKSVSSRIECENMCINSNGCSGATFNPVKRYCWTRTGESNITAGNSDDYALISEEKEALLIIKRLNNRLINLNKQISNEIVNVSPDVKKQIQDKNIKQKEMLDSYNNLLEEKLALDKQLQEYYSIEEEETNQTLYVNQQNLSLKLWGSLAFILILITAKKMINT